MSVPESCFTGRCPNSTTRVGRTSCTRVDNEFRRRSLMRILQRRRSRLWIVFALIRILVGITFATRMVLLFFRARTIKIFTFVFCASHFEENSRIVSQQQAMGEFFHQKRLAQLVGSDVSARVLRPHRLFTQWGDFSSCSEHIIWVRNQITP